MSIFKMALPRRTFLRGMGVTIALPLLDAMIPAFSVLARTPARPVKRLGFIYTPNGATMSAWTPAGEGPALTELSPTLSALAPFRDQVIVPTGLSQRMAESMGDGNGEHSRGQTVWLSGVHPKRTEGADVESGVTVDQIAAQALGKDTPLLSIEMALEQNYLVGNCDNGYSCVYWNTISWRTPTTPLPMEVNPRVVFERMFGDGGTPRQRLEQIREDRSILDSVKDAITDLRGRLGAGDRTRVAEYLDSMREIERRIQVAEKQSGESPIALPDRPVGAPESYDEHAKLMFDLALVAFQADITRVFTLLLGREQTNRPYPFIGVPEAHHSISHHQNDPVKLAKAAKINAYHIDLLARFAGRLRDIEDGDGTLLDHSMILQGGGLSNSDQHSHIDLPLVLVGGGAGQLKGGRHLRFPKDTPMNNLHMSLLEKVGVPVEKFGDSTGSMELEPLTGV
ncbi:MAG: hypothetical protein DMF95_30790 [Acidobacteria bacterium]|nr:MAG: hypothetical protein DMF96_16760 [Acidobacteriota bacterium]PYR41531.1 MAG: hypothetical protein DMF95_30790 [Acidobacteriota bacterium]